MKRVMYLSIGILCLMLAVVAGYHLGSQTARAQTLARFVDFHHATPPLTFALKSDGTYYWFNGDEQTYHEYTAVAPGDDYVAMHWQGESNVYALRGDGSLYHFDQQTWTHIGTIPGGAPVPTSNDSWGTIKHKSK